MKKLSDALSTMGHMFSYKHTNTFLTSCLSSGNTLLAWSSKIDYFYKATITHMVTNLQVALLTCEVNTSR